MRYDNNKRFLKSIYKKYSGLDLSSIKQAILFEKELKYLREVKFKPISSDVYYKEKKRLLLEKKRLMFLIERSKLFSEDFKFTTNAYSHSELLDLLNTVWEQDRNLDSLYKWNKYINKNKTM